MGGRFMFGGSAAVRREGGARSLACRRMKGNNRLPHSRGSALSFGRRIAILSAMPRRESTPPTNAFRRNAAEGGAVRSGRAVAPLSAPAIGAPVTAGTMGGANAPSRIDPDFTRDILPLDGIFLHNGLYRTIMDWTHKDPFRHADLIRMNEEKRDHEKESGNERPSGYEAAGRDHRRPRRSRQRRSLGGSLTAGF